MTCSPEYIKYWTTLPDQRPKYQPEPQLEVSVCRSMEETKGPSDGEADIRKPGASANLHATVQEEGTKTRGNGIASSLDNLIEHQESTAPDGKKGDDDNANIQTRKTRRRTYVLGPGGHASG
ncbi:hypothetical protein GLOTRDRAFT_133340 [Gloeophyllum trabeum ATCC 11539]|uniref:Uncharacterized protein n=1 Tax=Gloeophyllum trabeum (strain ATCC 11539 / FP-39264 / Madison 617) TaxID=670483 RepID=S7REX7_GLOTA|nr:uncharacterized protein GLOTRDRAFT_133340 [Gloeophyllum trabeum ATCC 11539]EPQ51014.1 hypothetical protein GLOTRDRAFT_133340 [Gloeophyllum trabeum ATCC 11539]